MCPDCKVFAGTPSQVLAHLRACREAHTCPTCGVRCDSQPKLIAHIVRQCSDEDSVGGRKRRREDDERKPSKTWQPDRNRNDKNDVNLYWMISHVQEWLELVELSEYKDSFAKEKVDGRVLLCLTEEQLLSLPYSLKANHAKKFIQLRTAFH